MYVIILCVDISVLIGHLHVVLELRHLSKGQDVDPVLTTAPGRVDKNLSDCEGNRISGDSSGNLLKLV